MSSSKRLDDVFQIATGGCKSRREHALSLICALAGRQGGWSESTLWPYPPIEPGEGLKLSEQPVDSVFIVSRGTLKHVSQFSLPGAPHVCGFYGAGSIIDVSHQLGSDCAESLIAIERSRVCRIRAHLLPMEIRKQLAALVRTQLGEAYDFQLSLLTWTAGQKVAAFLLQLDQHLHTKYLRRPMSDTDIASYLGIDESALKNALGWFLAQRWIGGGGHEIELLDAPSLSRLASG